MGLLSLLPKEDQYFDLFTQMTLYISSAARELKEMLADKNHDYGEYAQRIKGLEHACDELTHNISTRLNKSFITPFDREDIYMMSSALDDIVDLIDRKPVPAEAVSQRQPGATPLILKPVRRLEKPCSIRIG